FVSILVSAQKTIRPVGFVLNISLKEVGGYIDMYYFPSKRADVRWLYSTKYSSGEYTDREGLTHIGFIKQTDANDEIAFREISDKPNTRKKLSAKKVRSYKIGLDSFFVKDNVKLISVSGKDVVLKSAFLSNVFENDKIKIHKFFYPSYSYPVYIIESSNELFPVPKNAELFTKTMPEWFEDYKYLSDKIANEEYTYKEMGTIIALYELYHKVMDKKPIYFDQDWKEIENKDEAVFYADVSLNQDSLWTLNYYDFNDKKLIEGNFSSFGPEVREGKFTWYYPNGNKLRETKFKNDEQVNSTKEYFENGKLHWEYYQRSKEDKEEPIESFLGVSPPRNEDVRRFQKVYDNLGNKLFDRDGEEILYDPYLDRKITRRYKAGLLVESFFFDSEDGKIYQQVDGKNAKLKSSMEFLTRIPYPQESIVKGVEGLAMARIIIGLDGKIIDSEIIKGVDEYIDEAVISHFKELENKKVYFKPAKSGKTKVFQEIVVPIYFSIENYYKEISSFGPYYLPPNDLFPVSAPLHVNPPSFPR
ncbi:MAG: energy transducer TonB, partial [Bacteroidota bacterium]